MARLTKKWFLVNFLPNSNSISRWPRHPRCYAKILVPTCWILKSDPAFDAPKTELSSALWSRHVRHNWNFPRPDFRKFRFPRNCGGRTHVAVNYFDHFGWGSDVGFVIDGHWMCLTPPEEWELPPELKEQILKDFREPFGDRRNEIVCIGKEMNEKKIRERFEECLLTAEVRNFFAF